MTRLLRRLRGHAIAICAVAVALGGTSYAAVTVSGRDIRDGTVAGVDIRDGSVAGRDVKDRSLSATDLRRGALPRGRQGRPGPAGSAFSTYHDMAIEPDAGPEEVARLEVPATGGYFVLANATADDDMGFLDCALVARDGNRVDSDRQVLEFEGFINFTSTVLHTFVEPGHITLTCDDNGSFADLSNIKVTAVPVGSISNKPF